MKKIIFLLSFLVSFQYLYCQEETGFFWNFGNANIHFDVVHSEWNGVINFLEINWVFDNNIYLGITPVKMVFDDKSYYSILPFEIGYQIKLFRSDLFNLLFYNRLEWQYRDFNTIFSNSSRLYDSIGAKLVLRTIVEDWRYNLNWVSLFTEYTSANEWKIGVSVDLALGATVLVALIIGNASNEKK